MWTFDSVAEEGVSFVEFVPATWERFDVELWWTRLGNGGGSGDVAWRMSHHLQTAAPTVNDLQDGPLVTDSLPTSPEMKVTTLARGLTDGGGPITFQVTRLAVDTRDTATGSAALYALVLRRS
jgi:hypothetical protein